MGKRSWLETENAKAGEDAISDIKFYKNRTDEDPARLPEYSNLRDFFVSGSLMGH